MGIAIEDQEEAFSGFLNHISALGPYGHCNQLASVVVECQREQCFSPRSKASRHEVISRRLFPSRAVGPADFCY